MTTDPKDVDTRRSGVAAKLTLTQKRAHRLAFYDQLTGLPNRRCFKDVLARLQSTHHPHLALLLLDIDELAAVNDTSGHEAADDLIRRVADCLQAEIADDDVYRIGGDEFAVVDTTRGSHDDLASLAERLLAAIRTATADGRLPKVTISIGGALATDGNVEIHSISRDASLALRRAKETHRGGYVAFDAGMRTAVATRAEVLGTVSKALAEGRMSTHYQPLVLLESRKVIGLEALSRLTDPAGTVVPAGRFQAAFSDPVIAMSLTDEMLRQVASDIRGGSTTG